MSVEWSEDIMDGIAAGMPSKEDPKRSKLDERERIGEDSMDLRSGLMGERLFPESLLLSSSNMSEEEA